MTGQRADVPGEDMYPSRDDVTSESTYREPGRVPGPRNRAAAASHGQGVRSSSSSARRGRRTAARQPRRGGAALLVWAVPVVGAVIDELLGSSLGWAFAIAAVVAAGLAAAACSRAGAWWVVCAPPLVVMAVTIVAEQLARSGSSGKALTTSAVHWAVDAFPAMAAAELTVAVVLGVRMIRARRRGSSRA